MALSNSGMVSGESEVMPSQIRRSLHSCYMLLVFANCQGSFDNVGRGLLGSFVMVTTEGYV